MPTPKPGESQKDFVSRCIPIVMDEGTAKDNKQAAAICYSMYRKGNKSMDALKFMKLMEMGARDYARQQAWDVRKAAEVLAYIADLSAGEIGEPTDVSKLTNIMREIMQFIESEIQELELSSRDIAGKSKGDPTTDSPEPEEQPETVPAEVKETRSVNEHLNLSYVKALGSNIDESDLAVKYVSRDTIRHPVFLWGNENKTDLEGEFFTKQTDFWDSVLGKSARPLTWDHALDPDFEGDPLIGKTVEWEDDDIARWAISVLEKGHKYRDAIDKLIKTKSLGSASIATPLIGASSDSAPQYVKRVKVGNAIWLERWPWFATALTPVPCEPRMIGVDGKGVEFLKSLGIALPDTPDIDVESETAILDYFKVKYHIGD